MNLSKSASFFSHLVELRRAIHAEPELAYAEVKTAQKIIKELESLHLPYEYHGQGSGVIARLLSKDPKAPTVAIRAEMDGLPGDEKTGLSFSSKHAGCMHACGHDAHMAMVLGAARLLVDSPPPGNVVFIFQPAEEKGPGSKKIIEMGGLNKVQAIFAGHVTQHYRLGQMMVNSGVITAQSDCFFIRIHGKGGHGARPHETIDAIGITGSLISAIQTLVSREINPFHPSVITIGKISGGNAVNVIAEHASLEGTIRTILPEVRKHIWHGLKRITNAIADLYNAEIDIEIAPVYPPIVNTEMETELALAAAKEVVSSENIVPMEYPSMGADDFSYYLNEVPGCYVRFGAGKATEEFIPLHSPSFDVDEKVLLIGAEFFNNLVRRVIKYYGNE